MPRINDGELRNVNASITPEGKTSRFADQSQQKSLRLCEQEILRAHGSADVIQKTKDPDPFSKTQ